MTRGARLMFSAVLPMCLWLAFSPRLAPYAPDLQQRDFPLVPPMGMNWSYHEGLTYCAVQAEAASGHWSQDCERRFSFIWWSAGRLLSPQPGRPYFAFGSDALGRDQLSRVIAGGRVSLLTGAIAATVAVAIGVVVGLLAGYAGPWTNRAATTATTLVLTCPWLYLLLAIRSTLPLSLPPEAAILTVTTVCALAGWPRSAIVFRALVETAKHSDAVVLSRTFGGGTCHIFRFHMLPYLRHAAMAQFLILAPQFVLAETTLSFFGLGVQEPGVSWGTLLASLRDTTVLMTHGWLAIPCIPIAVVFHVLQWVSRAVQYTDE